MISKENEKNRSNSQEQQPILNLDSTQPVYSHLLSGLSLNLFYTSLVSPYTNQTKTKKNKRCQTHLIANNQITHHINKGADSNGQVYRVIKFCKTLPEKHKYVSEISRLKTAPIAISREKAKKN